MNYRWMSSSDLNIGMTVLLPCLERGSRSRTDKPIWKLFMDLGYHCVCVYLSMKTGATQLLWRKRCVLRTLTFVSLRPFYLPREFPNIFVTLVNIHPKSNVDTATLTILKTVHRLQSIASIDQISPILLWATSITVSLDSCFVTCQYVTCATSCRKCLDHCYGSKKGTYISLHRAPLDMSDHNVDPDLQTCPEMNNKLAVHGSGLVRGIYSVSPGFFQLPRLRN